ncbi:MAG TPA: choice-of-anchor Q domain-containing protein [Chitinophagaceae bacterium]|jgi:hypothetical protein
MKQVLSYSLVLLVVFFFSCRKDTYITSPDAEVAIGADTLHFDTVFTTTGSITQFFKINNNNNQKLRVNSIALQGGSGSAFKINVDGTVGPQVNDIDIDANDSIYVFVSVTVNPNAANLPFVIRDSIQISYNGNKRFVQLEAWGQNAHFLRNAVITGNTSWNNTLPYVILGSLQVDTNVTLTIQQGTKVYMHADAPILVDGTLKVSGDKYDSTRVYFSSDRLDYPYNGYPGSWPGIYFRDVSKDNVLLYAVVRNAYQGMIAELPSVDANPKLTLNECIVDNAYDAGVYGVQSSITATNCLVSNCGKNVALTLGGNYQFTHCTIATISNDYIPHKDPVLYVSNYALQGTTLLTSNLVANFTNCIAWGANGIVDDEVVVGQQGNTTFNVVFNNCLWKVKNNPANVTANNIIANQDPLFDSLDVQNRVYNFRLKPNSPAINKGINTAVTIDLDGNPRPVGLPDIGCYEQQ